MQLGQITRNQIIGLIMFLEVVVIGLVVWFALMPKNEKIKELDGVIKQKTEKVRQVETTKKELKELKIEVSELKADIGRLEQHFKKELFLPRTLPLLEKLADRTKVTLVGLKPGSEKSKKPAGAASPNASAPAKAQAAAPPAGAPAQPGGGQGKVKKTFSEAQEFEKAIMEVQLTGTFTSIVNFVNELSTFPKLVVVDKIEFLVGQRNTSVAAGGSKAAPDVVQAKMPLTFYIQKQQSLVTLDGSEEQPNTQPGAEVPGAPGAAKKPGP